MAGYVHGGTQQTTPLTILQDQIDALTQALTHTTQEIQNLKHQVQEQTRITSTITATPARVHPATQSVPATRARQHILYLRKNGVRPMDIATASGLSRQSIARITNNRVQTIWPATEATILAIHLKEH